MLKNAIAEILVEIATLLELKGENFFKVRAYRSGARALERLEEDLGEIIEQGKLQKVRGIGATLAQKIETLYKTDQLDFYEDLKASTPAGIVEMLEISGLGAKKINALHEALGVDSIATLEVACQKGQVAALSGFGIKSEIKILKAIQNRKAYTRRYLWWDAHAIAASILEGLKSLSGVEQAEYAGSLRRKLETVGDLDFLVASSEPSIVMDWFTQKTGAVAVTARGKTKSSIRLESGLQADLRVVPQEQFFCALHHFTGSKEHNVMLRQRALERGLSLSEWGLFRKSEKVSAQTEKNEQHSYVTVGSEAELFDRLGLSYIPPELREGLGEIEAAEAGTFPRLIEEGDIRGAFHNHTSASDGHHSLEEMVAAADALGWDYLGIADHSKSSVHANGLSEERLMQQVEQIQRLNASGRFQMHVFTGVECDILPDGSLDFGVEVLGALDYVVVSVHSAFLQSEEDMTARIIRAIEHPCSTMMGHMTGRLLLRREPYSVNQQKVIDAAIACNKIVELNANPRRLDMDWRLWHKAMERGLLCSINPDAHSTERLLYYRAGVNVARKGWLTKDRVLNTWGLDAVKARLGQK